MKHDEEEVIKFLLSTEIIPLSLRIMEHGSELSKTVATFILQKILTDDTGLNYVCQTYERFSHVAMVLVGSDFRSRIICFSGQNGYHSVERTICTASEARHTVLQSFIRQYSGLTGTRPVPS